MDFSDGEKQIYEKAVVVFFLWKRGFFDQVPRGLGRAMHE